MLVGTVGIPLTDVDTGGDSLSGGWNSFLFGLQLFLSFI